jgi:hypothetical protein
VPVDSNSAVFENFPFDKYEIENCALTSNMLAAKPGTTYLVYMMSSSGGTGKGEPFGFLKANSNMTAINLFVLPYNFPRLWILLEELVNSLKMNPTPKWKQEFEKYLSTIPLYYIPGMKAGRLFS